MANTYTFSFYKGPIKIVKPAHDMGVKEAMDLIASDEYKTKIEALRNATNKTTKKVLKNDLPYLTFSGTFTKRSNDCLKNHSGLIVLDFDGLEDEKLIELKTSFKEIDWVCACWVSPSGNGLKVLVKILNHLHLESFLELQEFFLGNFSQDLDESGKDVARACFMSWDPELYFNPNSAVFEAKEQAEPLVMVQEKSVRLLKKQVSISGQLKDNEINISHQFKINKDLRRAAYVVQQIEKEQIDITDNDYDNRLTVGFALATLGEEAYDLYVRAVQFNDTDEDSRAKFDDALAKGKFTTPAKFFSLAKNCGLEVKLPQSIMEKQKMNEACEVIGNEVQAKDWVEYGIYLKESEGIYYSLSPKNIPQKVSNFKMRILFHVNTSDQEAYRLIVIKNIDGFERVININTDDFVSAMTFKKVLARQGNFLWQGQDSDLVKLQVKLQREEKPTTMVKNLGYNKRHNFYAFANGLYDLNTKKMLEIDSYGIVETKDLEGKPVNFFIPALSKIFADKDDMYSNDKKFKLMIGTAKFSEWSDLFCKVFGTNGRIGIAYYLCSLFSDVIFRSMGARFPILFAYGKRGSGKGTMIQSMMTLFGERQDQIMLGGSSTAVGFMRKMAQFINAFVWLDEYKNNLPTKIVESIKNIYDRIGYERGKKDNSFQTESTPITSACVLSGQEMPTIEPALFTRTMLISFSETNRTEKQRQMYRALVTMEKEGLSHLTVGILWFRDVIVERFQESYESELREFADFVNNNDIDERMLGNWSMMITMIRLFSEYLNFPFTVDEFRDQCKDLLISQFKVLEGSDDTSKFWQVIEQMFSAGEILEDKHFKLADRCVFIRIQDVYQLYAEAMHRRRDPNVLDKSTLEDYLQTHSAYVGKKKSSFGGKYTWAFQFKYSDIGVDLLRGTDENQLREKMTLMGIKWETEPPAQKVELVRQTDMFNDGFGEADKREVQI